MFVTIDSATLAEVSGGGTSDGTTMLVMAMLITQMSNWPKAERKQKFLDFAKGVVEKEMAGAKPAAK